MKFSCLITSIVALLIIINKVHAQDPFNHLSSESEASDYRLDVNNDNEVALADEDLEFGTEFVLKKPLWAQYAVDGIKKKPKQQHGDVVRRKVTYYPKNDLKDF